MHAFGKKKKKILKLGQGIYNKKYIFLPPLPPTTALFSSSNALFGGIFCRIFYAEYSL